MATLAILSIDGLFLGTETVDTIPDPLPPFRIPVDDVCDLAPGEARWDPDAETFRFTRPRPWQPGIYTLPGGGAFVVGEVR